MLNSRFTSSVRYVIALCAAVATLSALFATAAQADPNKFSGTVLAGTGSDTIQDVFDAFNGFENGQYYTPLNTGSPNFTELVSFDATGTACITTKVNGPAFDRPNGSSNGRRFLSVAFGGGTWGTPGVCNAAGRSTTGFADYARSSSGPSSGDTGTDLTYIPMGRDALSFGYYKAGGGTVVSSLTRAQITTLFTTGRTTINGVSLLPCGIQTGSGTYQFWQTVTTASTAQEDAATAECRALGGRAQENDAADLKALGDLAHAAVPGTQVVIGFSAGSFISKANGAAAGGNPASFNVSLGSISNDGAGNNLGLPIQGSAPNLTPNPTFYANGVFGRNVYVVLASSTVGSFLFGDLNKMFVGPTSSLCTGTTPATIAKFGFQPLTTGCGSTTLKGSYLFPS